MEAIHPMKPRCGATTSNGSPCRRWPIAGGRRCPKHGGGSPQAKAKAAIRAELAQWSLNDTTRDPSITLLQLLSQSAARAELLAAELETLVEEFGLPGALVGEATVLDRHGTAHQAGDYVRALAQLEANERDRCARMCVMAINAGIGERMVRVTERTGEEIAAVLRAVMANPDLGFSDSQRAALPGAIRAALALVPGTS